MIYNLISKNQALYVHLFIIILYNDTMATCEVGVIGNSKHELTLTGRYYSLW